MTRCTLDFESHPRLAGGLTPDLLHPERLRWTPGQLAELTRRVAEELPGPLTGILRFDTERRWWARLALTDGVELWLLSWLPGQHTPPHDHGGAAGAFTVLQGRLTETYRSPGRPLRTRVHEAGAGSGFGLARTHQLSAEPAPSASVHAYSPPLLPTREYASFADAPAEPPAAPPLFVR
ncbi:cysteine dioxygenase [Amycolatopsis rhizosphaerae]|uniref:cysteine dioxygenase n=1 Tax=Amycolatopsis rhizosphaerae TaxID=2053003 RepID=UPI001C9619E4|nr:cysteine dioxygenase family protein [Amycolatopsis rhizosphaerae]